MTDYLMHYGIKGMKWGRRRYQNEDGKLTPAGKKRYDDSSQKKQQTDESPQKKQNIIKRHESKLIEKYKAKGYNQNAAEIAAKQQMKTEAILGAIGAVAITAVSLKVAKRVGEDYVDKTIKSGKIIQNIGPSGDVTFKNAPFFAAINRHDKRAYGNLYGNEKRNMVRQAELLGGPKYQGIYKNKIKLTKDVKRASVNNARKIFYEKMDSDPEFKKQVIETLKKTQYGRYGNSKKVFSDVASGKHSKQFYDRFNQALATPEFQSAGLHNKYYDSLKKHGYNALLDINDTRYSGYKNISKSPTIFFGDDKWEKKSSTKLGEDEITKNAYKYASQLVSKNLAKQFGVSAGALGTSISLSRNKQVNKYIEEHPNTKLSRKEILKKIEEENYRN